MNIFFLFLINCSFTLTNYIVNGDFSNPDIRTDDDYYDVINVQGTLQALPWIGFFDLKGPNYYGFGLGHGQYIDLQTRTNGYAYQIVTLPYDGIYHLSFLQKPKDQNYNSYNLQVWWNNASIFEFEPINMSMTNISLELQGNAGNNTLLFKEVSLIQDKYGTLIDQVQLNLVYILNNTDNITKEQVEANLSVEVRKAQQIWSWSSLVPLNQIPVSKYCTMLLEDLWLYPYDQRPYRGLLKDILESIQGLQNIKWQLVGDALNIRVGLPQHWVSDYKQFSRPQILQIQDKDQNMMRVLFPWFTFELIFNMTICLSSLIVFRITYSYCISKFFRRYYFFFFCVLQANIEPNFAYLVYFCFAHFEIFFSFTFFDKLSMAFAVFVFFIVIIFCLTFYAFLGRYLKAKACYFIFCFYRCNASYLFLTVRFLLRGFLRGALHFFLLNYDTVQKLTLCFVEISMLICTIFLENKRRIFLKKSFFVLFLLYHGVFTLFNLYLIIEVKFPMQDLAAGEIISLFEQCLIYSFFVINIFIMIVDLIPLSAMKPSKQQKDQDIKQKAVQNKRGDQKNKNMKIKIQRKQLQKASGQIFRKYFLVVIHDA